MCGRTLLFGERSQIYLHGGGRHEVCELCTGRAVHAGWIREGTVAEYADSSARGDGRRSLLGRLRGRRDAGADQSDDVPYDDFDDLPESQPPASDWPEAAQRPAADRRPPRRRRGIVARDTDSGPGRDRDGRNSRAPAANRKSRPPAPGRDNGRNGGPREPRHVRAVPTSVENKTASAVSLFNRSEHPKTVAGIGRSLGLPDVAVYPLDPTSSVVNLVVSWELCWYRYQVDLSDETPQVRGSAQGYELSELSELDRRSNASANDRGRLKIQS